MRLFSSLSPTMSACDVHRCAAVAFHCIACLQLPQQLDGAYETQIHSRDILLTSLAETEISSGYAVFVEPYVLRWCRAAALSSQSRHEMAVEMASYWYAGNHFLSACYLSSNLGIWYKNSLAQRRYRHCRTLVGPRRCLTHQPKSLDKLSARKRNSTRHGMPWK